MQKNRKKERNNTAKKSSRLRQIRLGLFFLLGLAIFLYPTLSNRWNQYRAGKLISEFENIRDESGDDADYSGELEKAQEYNRELVGSVVPDVFSVHEGQTDPRYESLLNISKNGMMGYIEIPVINVELPLYHYTTAENLQNGAGHIFGSSLPVGGASTHAIISAHRGLPSARMFTDLNLVKEGDQFYLHILGEVLAYEVDQVLVTKPTEVDSLAIEEGQDYVTLVTCTPYAVNTDRLLVRGHRVLYEEETYQEEQEKSALPHAGDVIARIFCVLLGILIAAAVVFVLPEYGKKKKQGGKKDGR